MKKLWTGFNQIINKINSEDNAPTCIEIDRNGTVDYKDWTKRAKAFNTNYPTVAQYFLKKCKYLSNNFLSKTSRPYIICEYTKGTLWKIDTSKSAGPNSIPQPLLKSIKDKIAGPLSNMFNMSFSAGNVQNYWYLLLSVLTKNTWNW